MRAFQLFQRGAIAAAALVVWICLANSATAQNTDPTPVTSPFQEDFEYEVGTDLEPLVEVDGVRWMRFSVRLKSDREYERAKAVPVTVEVDLFNTGESADVLLIVLFEAENGTSLDRLELDSIGAGRDRLKEVVQKHKITASVLADTRRVYLFFEVSRK
ncbi:MAG: hypothetical protein QNL88_00405 [Acidobacteriota bacterium]|nr:hypothetical protein [Acidobacteriota bacterium]